MKCSSVTLSFFVLVFNFLAWLKEMILVLYLGCLSSFHPLCIGFTSYGRQYHETFRAIWVALKKRGLRALARRAVSTCCTSVLQQSQSYRGCIPNPTLSSIRVLPFAALGEPQSPPPSSNSDRCPI